MIYHKTYFLKRTVLWSAGIRRNHHGMFVKTALYILCMGKVGSYSCRRSCCSKCIHFWTLNICTLLGYKLMLPACMVVDGVTIFVYLHILTFLNMLCMIFKCVFFKITLGKPCFVMGCCMYCYIYNKVSACFSVL